MPDINFDNFKVRCSAIKKILSDNQSNPTITEKQMGLLSLLENKEKLTENQKNEMARLIAIKKNSQKVVLSETCIDYLMEVYAWETEQMIPVSKESLDLLQLKKGKMAESESIELLSIYEDVFYQKNDERVSNDYLSGEPDIFTGKSIMEAEVITDTKTIWDYPLFLKKIHQKLENGYPEQVKGYCDITGAKNGRIARCLVTTPPEIRYEIKWKVAKKFGALTLESPEFLQEWEKWERSMVFDHIPIAGRVHLTNIEPFTEHELVKLYDRVKICREWLNNFHKNRLKLF